jgi:hypothetical protein
MRGPLEKDRYVRTASVTRRAPIDGSGLRRIPIPKHWSVARDTKCGGGALRVQ